MSAFVTRALLLFLALVFCDLPLWSDDADQEPRKDHFIKAEAQPESREDRRHFLRSIPAPRGLVVDRHGEVLAGNRIARRVVLNLRAAVAAHREKEIEEVVEHYLDRVRPIVRQDLSLDAENVKTHWEQRPFHPLAITGILSEPAEEDAASCLAEFHDGILSLQALYLRTYPAGESVAHLVGYVGSTAPDQHGPISVEEALWSPTTGRHGIEKSLDSELSGRPGLVSVVYDLDGNLVSRQLVRPPRPGRTIVLSLNLKMQEKALELLRGSERSGAFVAMDSRTGDILAAASYPTFDSGQFVPTISQEVFAEWVDDPEAPLFNRAISASYPPGSTLKPFVALAGLKSDRLSSLNRFSGPPSMDIDGKIFQNWNDNHEGRMDVRYALLRSCNTWFYQAAFNIRDEPILELCQQFGLGRRPDLPLGGVADGNLPPEAPSRRGLANLSIGQGAVLASPLQMASAMTGLANERHVARPRLVLQLQDESAPYEVREFDIVTVDHGISSQDLKVVREGLWGVVNHGAGTGRRASATRGDVFGKTGTSQWTSNGKERTVAWFAGYLDSERPRLSYAAVIEGRVGESVSGGRSAAPLIGQFLTEIYAEPEAFQVAAIETESDYHPTIAAATGGYRSSPPGGGATSATAVRARTSSSIRRTPPPRRGFFARLFGR